MLLFEASSGDANKAGRRLKTYYEHASKGSGEAYLIRCQIANSWATWQQKCAAARDNGILGLLRKRTRRRRQSTRILLHRWHGILAQKAFAKRVEALAATKAFDIQRLMSAAWFFKRLKQERHVTAVPCPCRGDRRRHLRILRSRGRNGGR